MRRLRSAEARSIERRPRQIGQHCARPTSTRPVVANADAEVAKAVAAAGFKIIQSIKPGARQSVFILPERI